MGAPALPRLESPHAAAPWRPHTVHRAERVQAACPPPPLRTGQWHGRVETAPPSDDPHPGPSPGIQGQGGTPTHTSWLPLKAVLTRKLTLGPRKKGSRSLQHYHKPQSGSEAHKHPEWSQKCSLAKSGCSLPVTPTPIGRLGLSKWVSHELRKVEEAQLLGRGGCGSS